MSTPARLIVVLALLAPLLGCVAPSDWVRIDDPSLMPPELEREFRGLWVATVDNIDWPSRPGLSAAEQQAEAVVILDLAVALNLNTVVFQCRPAADAFYRSSLEPWSAFLTGEQGTNPGYDPLAFWVQESHARGLDLHAWINPFRAWHPKTPGEPHRSSAAAREPNYLVEHGEYLWLDPGDKRARDHSLRVIRDIVSRYDIDGIHVDDYFYPYPIEGTSFADDRTFDAYRQAGGELTRGDWRRWNIDRFVRTMYAQAKRIKPGVLVGVSPFGIWRPGYPEQVVGFDAYEELAADARRWLREGWLDYASPQLYWKVESTGQPFEPLLDWWTSQNTAGRHIWPGLYLTRIKADGGWEPADITKQIQIIQDNNDASGLVLFSAVGLIQDRQGINSALMPALDGFAAVPESHWIDMPSTSQPTLSIRSTQNSYLVRTFSKSSAHGLILWTRYGERWSSRFIQRSEHTTELPYYNSGDPLLAIAAQSWGGSGRYSEPSLYHRLIPPPTIPFNEVNSAGQILAE